MTAAAQRVIEAIERDMQLGTVPSDVKSFEQLHEHADANQYLVNALNITEPSDADIERANSVIAEVDRWLASR